MADWTECMDKRLHHVNSAVSSPKSEVTLSLSGATCSWCGWQQKLEIDFASPTRVTIPLFWYIKVFLLCWHIFWQRKVTFKIIWLTFFRCRKFLLWKLCQNIVEISFCYQNISHLLWEIIVLVIEKNFWNSSWRPRICKIFDITRIIYSNSERSEQFLLTDCFFK